MPLSYENRVEVTISAIQSKSKPNEIEKLLTYIYVCEDIWLAVR
jgi:hypothetical protein